MTPAQCRAARALLDWSAADLAAAAGLDPDRLAAFERGTATLPPAVAARLLGALEGAGVLLVPEDSRGAGVRLRRPAAAADEGIRPQDLNSANDG